MCEIPDSNIWPFLSINTVRYTDLPQMVNRIPSCILSWHICVIGSQCWFSVRLIINNAVERFMLHCKGVSLFDVASQCTVCLAEIEIDDLGLQKYILQKKKVLQCLHGSVWLYICVCVHIFLWLRLGVNGPEHNDRFKELLGYMSCVNFQE